VQPPQWNFQRFALQCTCQVIGTRSFVLTFHRLHFGFDQLIVVAIHPFQFLQGQGIQVAVAQIRLDDLSDFERK